jgi:hypothetical protein
MTMREDEQIGADFRAWIQWRVQGRRSELEDLFDDIVAAGQTGFPMEPALMAMSKLGPRKLWKTFNDDDLQDLYDLAMEAGLPTVAKRFLDAERDAPVIDDGKIPRKIREQVLDRAGHRCQCCGATERLSIDHKLVPWSEGGSSRDPLNLQVLCVSCNARKGASVGVGVGVGKTKPR